MSAPIALVRTLDAIEADAYADMLAAAPPPVAAGMGLAVRRVAGATLLLASRAPVSLFNRVIGLGNDAPATEADLDTVLAVYRDAGAMSPWVHVGPASEPLALRGWLGARGFAPPARKSWAKVVRGTEAPPEFATDLTTRELDGGHASALASVLAAAHGMPPPIVPWVAAMVGRPGWRAYGAFDGDTLAGGGFLWTSGERAWLGMAGTLEAHRRRGGQKAVMVARIRDAIAMGCTVITTETGEPVGDELNPSLTNMLRCGFRLAASRDNYALGA